MTTNSFTLKPGMWCNRRDGKVVGPARQDARLLYPFIVGGKRYTVGGHYSGDDLVKSPFDLISEAEPPEMGAETVSQMLRKVSEPPAPDMVPVPRELVEEMIMWCNRTDIDYTGELSNRLRACLTGEKG
jgi:hypothetical protein